MELFGSISRENCINNLFYGTDYHSHLGTKRGGLAVMNSQDFSRSIHNIDKIRQRLRLTTLEYQRLEDLVEAIGLPNEKICTHCWDGSSYF